MNCPQCGEICRCHSEPPPLALPQEPDQNACGAAESAAWRDELSARLNRYRARRKARPPRYPSLRLQFDSFESTGTGRAVVGSPPPLFGAVSNHALALDSVQLAGPAEIEAGADMLPTAIADSYELDSESDSSGTSLAGGGLSGASSTAASSTAASSATASSTTASSPSAKIIEFPRSAWAPPLPPPDQLADPITALPRILEVPEVEPPPPALGGITIEAARPPEAEKRPGIDIPLQGASLARRLLAVIIDSLIVAAASVLFGAIFWKITGVRPPLIQLVGLAVGLQCLLWSAYQYLLMVYSGATPGLRAVGLELVRFDGTATPRSLRRWRVLASYLSAASLGMGYAWAFLDEDVLSWHDRITHTYLAPKK